MITEESKEKTEEPVQKSKYDRLLMVGDIVFIKVTELKCSELKNYIYINKFLPEGTPKNYGHKMIAGIHTYAQINNVNDKVCVIFTPRIGTVKNIKNSTGVTKYNVLWQEREEKNMQKGLGRHNIIEEYYHDNLVAMKNIAKFMTEGEFVTFVESYLSKNDKDWPKETK